ncbi:unnamed protein product [Camellia sinensis]
MIYFAASFSLELVADPACLVPKGWRSRVVKNWVEFRWVDYRRRSKSNKKMLKPIQRLVTLAILNQTYSSEQSSSNPFIPFLINDHSILKRETKGSLPKLHYWMSNSWSKV